MKPNEKSVLGLFRSIRRKLIDEGNLQRYLIYASGEILLIMIGILLALQVNNWNENRKTANQESQYLHRLLSELRLDSLRFSNEIAENTKRNEQIANFTGLLNQATPDDSLLVAAAYEYFGHGWYLPHFAVSTSTFDDLASTGKLNIIQRVELRDLLVKQYASYNETKTKFHFNREWITFIDASFTAESDVMKFDPKTDRLFGLQSLQNKAAELRNKKDIYVRNAAAHFWINHSSITSINEQLMNVSKLIEMIIVEIERG